MWTPVDISALTERADGQKSGITSSHAANAPRNPGPPRSMSANTVSSDGSARTSAAVISGRSAPFVAETVEECQHLADVGLLVRHEEVGVGVVGTGRSDSRHRQVDQVVVDLGLHAVDRSVGGVPFGFDGVEHGGVERVGQLDRPLVRRRRIAGVADHHDRRGHRVRVRSRSDRWPERCRCSPSTHGGSRRSSAIGQRLRRRARVVRRRSALVGSSAQLMKPFADVGVVVRAVGLAADQRVAEHLQQRAVLIASRR